MKILLHRATAHKLWRICSWSASVSLAGHAARCFKPRRGQVSQALEIVSGAWPISRNHHVGIVSPLNNYDDLNAETKRG